MSDNLDKESLKIQKIIRSVIGAIGGMVTFGTMAIAIYFMVKFSSIILGFSIIWGLLPLDIIFTSVAIKSVKVECSSDEDDEEEKDEEGPNLTLIKGDENLTRENFEYRLDDFEKTSSDGIEPIAHLEIVNSDNKGYTRRRVINNNSNNNKN